METSRSRSSASKIVKLVFLFALAFSLQGMSLFLLRAEEEAVRPEQAEKARSGQFGFSPVITYTVNVPTDTDDANPGDGICADAEGNCSIRAAIQESNAFGQPSRIVFDVPIMHPSGILTFTMGPSPLPSATTPVQIDGTTQPDHEIHIDYTNTTMGNGLVLDGTEGSRITGLGLFNPPNNCIFVDNAPGSMISGNSLIGCGGSYGVYVFGPASAGTIISGNTMQNSPGGFRIESTMNITVTNNVLGPVDFFGGDAEQSSNLWILNNSVHDVGFGDGFASFGGVSDVVLENNSFSQIGRHGISAFEPTMRLSARGNTFGGIGSLPISLDGGVNEDIPPPQILDSFRSGDVITVTLQAPDVDPAQYVYPVQVEFFFNQGNTWLPQSVQFYEETDFPGPKEYVIIVEPSEPEGPESSPEQEPTEFVEATVTTADGNTSMISVDEVPLPIELLAFQAVVDGRDVVLEWSSAAEVNSAGFEVQSLRKGPPGLAAPSDWEPGDFIPARGVPHSYTYRMEQLEPGSYSFRLRLVDLDGTFSFSPQVEVQIEVAEAYELSAAYPNPFNPVTRFTLAVSQVQHVNIELLDLQGRRLAAVFDGRLTAHETYPFELDGSTLASGLYVLRVTGETFDVSRSVMLVK